MKPTFHASIVNEPFEDPCLLVRLLREGRNLLFDAGALCRLSAASMMRISDVFVTHAHMDHFIGIDELFRNLLRREEPLRIFGPEDIIECVEGKLRGYTWNLIAKYPLKVEVFGIGEKVVRHSSFYASNRFKAVENPATDFSGIIVEEPLFKVKALRLSHSIPVIAYSIEEEFHININKALLEERDFSVGPWLSDLKKAIRSGDESCSIKVDEKEFRAAELKEFADITRGQKISYLMDTAPLSSNIEKAVEFVRGSDILFCEAYFMNKDLELAEERHHLTAALAGEIARKAKVGALKILHFSPRYMDCVDELYAEAEEAFRGVKLQSA
ncbi:MAG: ribonuclease Z [Nitrospirae bacterium]|nr:ribonuclease Z [Nitrospirota bacterium]